MKTTRDNIMADIERTLLKDGLQKLRRKNVETGEDAWSDQKYRRTGLIMICEALECFFIPCSAIPQMRGKLYHYLSEEELKQDLQVVLEEAEIGFSAKPYVDLTSVANIDIQNVDSASLVASCMLHAKDLAKGELQESLVRRLDATVERALEYLSACACDNGGWGWDEDVKEHSLYFTWTAVETLIVAKLAKHKEEFLTAKSRDLLGWLEEHLEKTRAWLENEYLNMCVDGLIDKDNETMNPNLYVLQSLLWLETKQREKIAQGANNLVDLYYQDPELWKGDEKQYNVVLSGGKLRKGLTHPYIDRSVIPRLLKLIARCLIRGVGDAKRLGDFLDTVYSDLRRDRHTGTVFRDMWAGNQYQISYAERAIEALVQAHEACSEKETIDLTVNQATISGALDADSLSRLASALMEQVASDEELKGELKRLLSQVSETPESSIGEIANEAEAAGEEYVRMLEEAREDGKNQPTPRRKPRKK